MLGHSRNDATRTSVFMETVQALRGADSTRLDALLLTDQDLHLVSAPPELPRFLDGVIDIALGRVVTAKKEDHSCLSGAAQAALAVAPPRSVPFRLSTSAENVFVYGSVERIALGGPIPVLLFSFLHPQSRTLPRAENLVAWFGLSKTESAVAIELAGGKGVAEVATSRSLSELTVRTHLRTLFEKTSTHSQRDLVALLLRLAAL